MTRTLFKSILLLAVYRTLPATKSDSPLSALAPRSIAQALEAFDKAHHDLVRFLHPLSGTAFRQILDFYQQGRFWTLPIIVHAVVLFGVLRVLRGAIPKIEEKTVKLVLGQEYNLTVPQRSEAGRRGRRTAGERIKKGWSWKRINNQLYRLRIFVAEFHPVLVLVAVIGFCVLCIAGSVWNAPCNPGASNREPQGWHSVHKVILVECVDTFLQLFRPIKHLLPTELLPKQILLSYRWKAVLLTPYAEERSSSRRGSPMSRRANSPGKIKLSTHHLLTVALNLHTHLSTLLQFTFLFTSVLQQLFVQSLHSIILRLDSPVSDSILVILVIMAIQALCWRVQEEWNGLRRVVRCLEVVAREFPARGVGTNQDSLSVSTRYDGRSQEGVVIVRRVATILTKESQRRRESFNRVGNVKICTICFEDFSIDAATSFGDSSHGNDGSSSPNEDSTEEGEEEVCQLHCGHRYHSTCLVDWLHHQSFCPCCRATIRIPSI